jgi:mRNA turnover protein 4
VQIYCTHHVFCSCAGVVELVADYTVCTEGQNISPEASRILVFRFTCLLVVYVHFAYLYREHILRALWRDVTTRILSFVPCLTQRLLGVQMAAFKMHLRCRWAPDEFEVFETEESMQSDNPSDGS